MPDRSAFIREAVAKALAEQNETVLNDACIVAPGSMPQRGQGDRRAEPTQHQGGDGGLGTIALLPAQEDADSLPRRPGPSNAAGPLKTGSNGQWARMPFLDELTRR